jgi:transcriptional regulator with XRE-family HTH domain
MADCPSVPLLRIPQNDALCITPIQQTAYSAWVRDKDRVAYERTLGKIVGQRMCELRRMRGWSQVELEVETDGAVVRSTIGNFESGARLPSLYALSRIAKALGVPVAWFVLDAKSFETQRSSYALPVDTRSRTTPVLSRAAESEAPKYGKRSRRLRK